MKYRMTLDTSPEALAAVKSKKRRKLLKRYLVTFGVSVEDLDEAKRTASRLAVQYGVPVIAERVE